MIAQLNSPYSSPSPPSLLFSAGKQGGTTYPFLTAESKVKSIVVVTIFLRWIFMIYICADSATSTHETYRNYPPFQLGGYRKIPAAKTTVTLPDPSAP